jgi:NACalpha-BTF3-like transcription factor
MDARCIIKATGVSAARARQELEEAYLDPIEAILNIKSSKFKSRP